MTSSAETIAPSQLPELISRYLVAHRARDLDAAVACYTEDATVIDEGNDLPRAARDPGLAGHCGQRVHLHHRVDRRSADR